MSGRKDRLKRRLITTAAIVAVGKKLKGNGKSLGDDKCEEQATPVIDENQSLFLLIVKTLWQLIKLLVSILSVIGLVILIIAAVRVLAG